MRSKKLIDLDYEIMEMEQGIRKSDSLVASMGLGLFSLAILAIIFLTLPSCNRTADAAEITMNMEKIAMIESSGNPYAWRKADDSRGLYQITPICLNDYNNFHPKDHYHMDDLWNTSVSKKIADWYISTRIPQLLRHYGLPDTVRNRIVAWNAGVGYLVKKKPLPKVTIAYLKKYGAE